MAYISTNKPPVYGTVNPNNGSYFFNLNEQKWYDTSGNFMPNGMTFLPCITYADLNGQVEYVEQIAKTTYFDEVKANDYRGKNACTAWVNFDGTTTPPTIRDSYNVSSVVRTATGIYDVYFATPMDNVNYSWSVSGNESLIREYFVRNLDYITTTKIRVECGDVGFTQGINPVSYVVQIFGGKNV